MTTQQPPLTDPAAFALGELWTQAQTAFLEWVLTRYGSQPHQLRHETRKAYKAALKLFFLGHPEMIVLGLYTPALPWDVRPADAQRFQNGMITLGNANRTINQRLAALFAFYKYVRARHRLAPTPELLDLQADTARLYWADADRQHLLLWPLDLGNPFDPDVVDRVPVQPYDEKRVPSQADVKNLLAAIDRTTLAGLQDYALFFTIIVTARRISEITGLQWGDIRPGPDNTHIIRYRCKGGTIKEQAIGPAVYQAITDYLSAGNRLAAIQPDHYIFTPIDPLQGRRYKINPFIPLPYAAAQSRLKEYGRQARANLADLHLHGLRHRSAKDWVEDQKKTGKGVDYHQLQKKLGHESLGTTMIYGSALDDPADASLPSMEARYGLHPTQPTNEDEPTEEK